MEREQQKKQMGMIEGDMTGKLAKAWIQVRMGAKKLVETNAYGQR